MLFAKNSDRDVNEAQLLDWRPAATHDAGATVRCTWITIPQVDTTHAVLLSRPWWMWGAEMGANEHGVVIGNEAVFTDGDREPEPGLLGMDLIRLGLERATTAAEAVQVIVTLLEQHGQGGQCAMGRPRFTYDNSFIVADPNGAVVLETAGRRWATEEVTGGGRSISNGLTIPGFAEAHADRLRGRVAACAPRRHRTEAAAARATGPADLMAALRDHGPTGLPEHSVVNGAMSAPCMHAGGVVVASQSVASWVADLRDRPLHWATGTAAPCTSLFKPVRVEEPTDLGPEPTDHDDPATVWWRHERLHRSVLVDPGPLLARFSAERDRVEAAWIAAPPTTAAAFERAEALESRWLADVSGARHPDRRSARLRAFWRRADRTAGLPRVEAPA